MEEKKNNVLSAIVAILEERECHVKNSELYLFYDGVALGQLEALLLMDIVTYSEYEEIYKSITK